MDVSNSPEATEAEEIKRPLSSSITRLSKVVAWVLIGGAFYLLGAIVSHFFTGIADQGLVDALTKPSHSSSIPEAYNWLGLPAALISQILVFEWLGVSALVIPCILFIIAYNLFHPATPIDLRPYMLPTLGVVLWINTLLGYMAIHNMGGTSLHILCGGLGYESAALLYGLFDWTLPYFLFLIALFTFFYLARLPIISLFKSPSLFKTLRTKKNVPPALPPPSKAEEEVKEKTTEKETPPPLPPPSKAEEEVKEKTTEKETPPPPLLLARPRKK